MPQFRVRWFLVSQPAFQVTQELVTRSHSSSRFYFRAESATSGSWLNVQAWQLSYCECYSMACLAGPDQPVHILTKIGFPWSSQSHCVHCLGGFTRCRGMARACMGCACGGIDCSEKQSSRPSTKSVIASDMIRMVFEKVCALELLPLSPFLKLVNLTSDTEDRALRRV